MTKMRSSFDSDARKEIAKAVAIAGLSAIATTLATKGAEHAIEWVKAKLAPPPRAEEKEKTDAEQ